MRYMVFGSNLQGIHGAGAAAYARKHYGAQLGHGDGVTGRAYAIPTKLTPATRRALRDIAKSIYQFKEYARQHPHDEFLVTRVGCGLAGYTDVQIAQWFTGSPDNCTFDPKWTQFGLPPWKEAP